MNAPYSSDPSLQPSVAPERPQNPRQAPSVPISVYRELATELKATQAMVDSLTHQNQQLNQQNLVLRQEMVKFADSAAQLRQSVESSHLWFADTANQLKQSLEAGMPVAMPAAMPPLTVPMAVARTGVADAVATPASAPTEEWSEPVTTGGSGLASQFVQMIKPKPAQSSKAAPKAAPKAQAKRQPPQPQPPQRLYTEEQLEPSRSSQISNKTSDLSGLWLATTIVLIVVSAFGAGFLIMKPLLNNSR
ncbi:MAG: hypothetical protein ACFCVD_08925 [Nodosilinea sp.]